MNYHRSISRKDYGEPPSMNEKTKNFENTFCVIPISFK